MTTNEEETVRPFGDGQKGETIIRNEVPTKDRPEDFRRYDRGYFQQGVSNSFKFHHIPCALFNQLLQVTNAAYVDFATMMSDPACVNHYQIPQNAFTYIEDNAFRDSSNLVDDHCGHGTVGAYLGLDRGCEMRGGGIEDGIQRKSVLYL